MAFAHDNQTHKRSVFDVHSVVLFNKSFSADKLIDWVRVHAEMCSG